MRVLHFDLRALQGNQLELRCFWDNPTQYESRSLNLVEIVELTQYAAKNYYLSPQTGADQKDSQKNVERKLEPADQLSQPQDDLATIGRKLFNWLDGNERWLVTRLNKHLGEEIVLAISTAGQLAKLPWELLHNGGQFLVECFPAVLPVRWLARDQRQALTLSSQPQNRALRLLFMATSPRDVQPVLDYEREEAEIVQAAARPSIGLTVEESGCLEALGYLVNANG
jgi:hypothetical protein